MNLKFTMLGKTFLKTYDVLAKHIWLEQFSRNNTSKKFAMFFHDDNHFNIKKNKLLTILRYFENKVSRFCVC